MTVSTFYPNADPETTSMDGYAAAIADGTFAAVRADAGGFAADASDFWVTGLEATASSGIYDQMTRAFKLFDTSTLPDSDTIDAATLEFVAITGKKFDQFTEPLSLSLITTTPGSNTGLAASDYPNVGTTKQATDITVASIIADSATYNAFTLNATGLGNISKTGVSKFGFRGSFDNDNAAPTWGASLFGEVTGASAEEVLAGDKRPKLVVTHTAGADPEGSLLGGKLLRGGLLQHGVLVRH